MNRLMGGSYAGDGGYSTGGSVAGALTEMLEDPVEEEVSGGSGVEAKRRGFRKSNRTSGTGK